MPNLWNQIQPEHGIDIEELRRMGLLSSEGSNPAIDNAIPNTPAANPSLRRMVSEGSFAAAADRPGNDPPRQTETEAALGLTPQNPFNRVRPTRQQQYGQPTISADGRVPGRSLLIPDAPITPDLQPLTGSRKSLEQLNTARNADIDVEKEKKRSKFSRFWRGLGDAWDNWSGKGGLGGLLGEMLDQGISEARSPTKRAERVKRQGLEKFWNKYSEDLGIETAEQKRQQEMYGTGQKRAEYLQKQYGPLLKGFEANDVYTDEEAALATGLGIPMLPYDASKREHTTRGDTAYTRHEKGGGHWVEDVPLGKDPAKTRRPATFKIGGKDVVLNLTDNETKDALLLIADREEKAKQAVEKAVVEREEKVYKSRQEFQDDLRKWNIDDVRMTGQKAKAMKALEAQQAALNDPENQASRGDILKAIAAFQGEIAEADNWIANRKRTQPTYTPPPGEGKQKGGGPKVKGSEVNKLIQQNIDNSKQ